MSHVTCEFSFPVTNSLRHDCKQHFHQKDSRRLNASEEQQPFC